MWCVSDYTCRQVGIRSADREDWECIPALTKERYGTNECLFWCVVCVVCDAIARRWIEYVVAICRLRHCFIFLAATCSMTLMEWLAMMMVPKTAGTEEALAW